LSKRKQVRNRGRKGRERETKILKNNNKRISKRREHLKRGGDRERETRDIY
jgi:hypothetical protein